MGQGLEISTVAQSDQGEGSNRLAAKFRADFDIASEDHNGLGARVWDVHTWQVWKDFE